MKKSLCIETFFTDRDFYDRFALAREAGFDFVEFWSWQDKDATRILELCARERLGIASFSGDASADLVDPGQREAYLDFAEASMEMAWKLSCSSLVIHSNALGEGGVVLEPYADRTEAEKFGAMQRTLADLAPRAEARGIQLVLEALNTEVDHKGNFLASTRMAAAAIRLVDSPNLRILYDVYHMQVMEGNLVANIQAYADCIGYVHVADVPGRAEPGSGEINYARVFRALAEAGYEGFVGFELFPSRDPLAVARDLLTLF